MDLHNTALELQNIFYLHQNETFQKETEAIKTFLSAREKLDITGRFSYELREKFFKECATGDPSERDIRRIIISPFHVFEWFKSNVK